MQKGFSFVEILVALILLSSVSIVLFHYHWSVTQYLQQLRLRYLAVIEMENITEYRMIGERKAEASKPFTLKWLDDKTAQLSWFVPGMTREESMQRTWK